jgi:hypothetical protein
MVRACLAAILCALAGLAPAAAHASTPAPAGAHDGASIQMARFGSSRGFGRSPGFGRNRGFGRSRPYYGRRRGTGIFRRIIRALAIGYLLHLLFTTPGGLIVLVLLVVLVMLAVRRMRPRRYGY